MDALIRAARTLGTALCACVVAFGAPPIAAAETVASLERGVKAAYLYKFLSYVEWPSTVMPPAGSPFVIGVVGADDIRAELQRLIPERTVSDRTIEVRNVKDIDSLPGVHVVFIGRTEVPRRVELIRAAERQSTLVVSESEGALRFGSVINLVIVDGRVRFEVALDAAERSGLKLSSRLLALAQTVRPGGK